MNVIKWITSIFVLLMVNILVFKVRSSSLDMTHGGSGTTLITVTEGEPSEIKCTAVGARPAVTIDWYHMKLGGSETKITDGVSRVDTPNVDNADTFDSESTLNYAATKDYNGGSLRCVTTGHEVAESRQDAASLNVQFPPEITSVLYANKEVMCNVNANPEATSYAITVNYSEVFDPAPDCSGSECRFTYKVQEETNIRCNATNDLGEASKDIQATPGATMPPPPTTESQPLGTTKSNANGGGGSRITAAIIFGLLLSISSSCFYFVY